MKKSLYFAMILTFLACEKNTNSVGTNDSSHLSNEKISNFEKERNYLKDKENSEETEVLDTANRDDTNEDEPDRVFIVGNKSKFSDADIEQITDYQNLNGYEEKSSKLYNFNPALVYISKYGDANTEKLRVNFLFNISDDKAEHYERTYFKLSGNNNVVSVFEYDNIGNSFSNIVVITSSVVNNKKVFFTDIFDVECGRVDCTASRSSVYAEPLEGIKSYEEFKKYIDR